MLNKLNQYRKYISNNIELLILFILTNQFTSTRSNQSIILKINHHLFPKKISHISRLDFYLPHKLSIYPLQTHFIGHQTKCQKN